MRIMLTGASGQLGRCIQDRVKISDELLALTRSDLDITDAAAVEDKVEELKPDILINAAAYTAVDKAESEIESAYANNQLGAKNLAFASAKEGIPIIHVSTDYVFDGVACEPYGINSSTNPTCVYGMSKLAGEQEVAAKNQKHAIVRTAWVFSEYGNNFLKTMLKLGSERDLLGVVDDQIGSPTYAGDLAHALLELATYYTKGGQKYGVFHFAGDKPVSWYEFANVIFSFAVDYGILSKAPKVNPISTKEFPTLVKRPEYSALGSADIMNICNGLKNNWIASVREVVGKL
ncbi:dTDP-4-dehydrorhamnose reductase [Pseudoalteromonas piscicida]|uniref:dTDP-4-dehydrorhamnose reductase n=1 Tax=Pseudoalteromonas piscicida TaxID=43662 RepID=UPI0032C0BCA2